MAKIIWEEKTPIQKRLKICSDPFIMGYIRIFKRQVFYSISYNLQIYCDSNLLKIDLIFIF